MATQQDEGAVPDFLQMSGAGGPQSTNPHGSDSWYGWPSKQMNPVNLPDEEGRVKRVRAPVMDLEGLITPTELHYVVQHFDVPEVVPADQWTLTIDGEVKNPLTIDYEQLRRYPGRTVRTVMECSGSDATYFEYFKGEGPKPSRTQEAMILSAAEWTGAPLAAVLNDAGLTDKALYFRAEGWDQGIPITAAPGTEAFFYDKGLPRLKALHPDTLLCWALNGQLLEHLHGAPVRLLVPGWSGNWSVKWIRRLEAMDHLPDCWYHYNFYYYADSADATDKELITTIPVKSIVTQPNDDTERLPKGVHVVRGYAWSGEGAITQVEVSVDGGKTWHASRLEEPRDRWMWVRWSYLWDAQEPGQYQVMSRATDASGKTQSHQPRYNNMRKNFTAIVGYDIVIE